MNTQATTPTSNPSQTSKADVISLSIKEKSILYTAYMPFLSGGGLFIPTNKAYKMGDEVFLLLSLPNDNEKMNVAGKVVWINALAQNGKPQGIGIEFSQDTSGVKLKDKIDQLLGTSINANFPTYTM
jgi:type IV pilus assembly protein PilZ